MSSSSRLLVPLLLAAALGLACNKDQTRTQAPKIVLGATSLDFGRLQVGMQHVKPLTVKNEGNKGLTITAVDGGALFGTTSTLPLEVLPGGETQLLLSFSPVTQDKRETATLRITSNDPSTTESTVLVSGTGVEVAEVVPSPVAFGDVYEKETKTLTVTLTNRSSEPLTVTDATLTPEGVMGGELGALVTTVAPGDSVSAEVTFQPAQMGEVAGALQLQFDAAQRGPLTVDLTGKGTAALPRLCIKPVGSGTERCSPLGAGVTSVSQAWTLCDPAVTPDGTCAPGTDVGEADLYLRNEGNVRVPYTVKYTLRVNPNQKRCDGTTPETRSDFTFSNIQKGADGSVPATVEVAQAFLPADVADPQPWETAPVRVTYRPTSECADNTADLVMVEVSRQDGAKRQPTTVFATFRGQSLRPLPKDEQFACDTTDALPCAKPFYGVVNQGDAEVEVRSVKLYEPKRGNTSEASCNELLAGDPIEDGWTECTLDGSENPLGHCFAFSWKPDEAPSDVLPERLGVVGTAGNRAPLGTLQFGANVGAVGEQDCGQAVTGKLCPGANYCLKAVIETSDPYNRFITAGIRARLVRTAGP